MKRIDLIAGARPNFMKIAPIIDALNAAETRGGSLDFRLVHTGQHYDRAMSGSFFEELGIPDPDINLEVGSGTQAEQTAAIMVAYEKVLLKEMSDLCLVVGDVTSTMACSIAARKFGVPVAHVEGGIRSGDWTMPEEINRVVTDSITNWFFTTSESSETITLGTNELIGTDPSKLPPALARLMEGQWKKGAIPLNGTARQQSGSSKIWNDCWREHETTTNVEEGTCHR